MSEQPSLLKRIFRKLFSLLNISRKIIVNVVFFLVLFLFIAALGNDENEIVIPNNAALYLDFTGEIVEQKFAIDPVEAFMSEAMEEKQANPEVLLSDIIKVIQRAKNDHRIQTIVLNLHNVKPAGLSKLQDIAQALEHFKTSGKQVIAIGDNYSQDQYYLASHANEIWLNPKGWFLLEGYGRYQLYFKSALEKLSISQHVFRVGTFKSAVEPYMRDDMSEAAKEANKLWLNDLWMQYKNEVAKARGFEVKNFDENIEALLAKLEQANGNFAQYALDNGWVDQLKTREEMTRGLASLLGNSNDSFEKISFKNYLTATTPLLPLINPTTNKVAVIVAKGTILDGNQKPGNIGGDSTAKLLKKARNNPQVKAVVLRVDSPGGSAYASDIIRHEIELLKEAGKPVVASMGTYAASGGYWISAPADLIYAAPSTITGSIGIYGFFMTFEDTLSKVGIHTDGVGTTDLSGFGVTRPLTEGMGKIFQMSIDRGYQDFIQLVAKNRNMTPEEVDNVAQGRVWSGMKAKELGLVDELGNLTDAVNAAASLAKLSSFDRILIEKEKSQKDLFMQNLFGQAASILPVQTFANETPLEKFIFKLQQEYKQLNQMNDPQGIYSFCLTCSIH